MKFEHLQSAEELHSMRKVIVLYIHDYDGCS